jgi:hypothetical protein
MKGLDCQHWGLPMPAKLGDQMTIEPHVDPKNWLHKHLVGVCVASCAIYCAAAAAFLVFGLR